MRLIITADYEQMSRYVSDYIIDKINSHNSTSPFVLGLPTGSSPIGVYKNLVKAVDKGLVSFKNVVTFNMDEYVGLPEDHPESYHSFMARNLFDHIDCPAENIHILNGNAADLDNECHRYEETIASYGGIDLFLGGIGSDGHIVQTVMDAREVVILCNGHSKSRALQAAVEGPVTQEWTISALQMHRNGMIVCDEAATIDLKVGTYRYFKQLERF